ncbi:hypothetical protein B9Z55_016846 [Caenorhabditis nigoni]|uniref:Receptor L-domain domain-containing protein n=1 Tax=Caenorhabditis nigoni TaxID=1611254 RepID=A0A2G5T6H6_9PELO|nr:hypothetical protein B9Z55_016846 [Caenorhabditis nigoni]
MNSISYSCFLLTYIIPSVILQCGTVPNYIRTENCFSEPECDFKHIFVSSDTIKLYPSSCETVCGDLVFDANTDLSESELTGYFQNLKFLNGSLRVELTNFKSLDFLSSLEYIQCADFGLLITRNSKLINLDVIENWKTDASCVWHIQENVKLNAEVLCMNVSSRYELDVYGNLKDCGCHSVHINSLSIPYFPKCTSVTGGLKVTNINNNTKIGALTFLKTVDGPMEIYDTLMTNLSCFRNLETISGGVLKIHDNPNLNYLNWGGFTKLVPDNFTVHIFNNHPEFCLFAWELQTFAEANANISGVDAKICHEILRRDMEITCEANSFDLLPSNCIHILGDVIVNSEAEKTDNLWKLEKVTNIFGSLTIEKTENITNLRFLRSLERIARLKKDHPPLLRILSNKSLKNVSLPNMRNAPYSPKHDRLIEISGNSLEIFKTPDDCSIFQNSTKSVILYNGRNCTEIGMPELPGNVGLSAKWSAVLLFPLFSFLTLMKK